jgi:hypothetical protein
MSNRQIVALAKEKMTEVEDFIYAHEGPQRDIMLLIHNLLVIELNLTDKLRYKIPFYYGKSWICYFNPGKDGGIEFSFLRGNELSNAQGLLQSKGRKQVWSIQFSHPSGIPMDSLKEAILEAVLLDETIPYAPKRKKRKS